MRYIMRDIRVCRNFHQPFKYILSTRRMGKSQVCYNERTGSTTPKPVYMAT